MIDGFIYYAGGKRVLDLFEGPNPPSNADYIFEEENIVLELKILETEYAETEAHFEKFRDLVYDWMSDNRLHYRAAAGLEPSPPAFVEAYLKLFIPPLQRVTDKANKQIKKTKEYLKLPDAKGVVLYLDEGFLDLDPHTISALIGDPLNRMMSGIDSYVLFSFRQRVLIEGDSGPRIFWDPRYRDKDKSADLSEFINRLGGKWLAYLQELGNQKFRDSPLPNSSYEEMFRTMKFVRST